MDTIKLEDSTGEMIEVYPAGTRIRHKKHSELTGIIWQLEYHESGKISPLPYLVHWDDSQLASDKLGWFFVYPIKSEIEPIESVK